MENNLVGKRFVNHQDRRGAREIKVVKLEGVAELDGCVKGERRIGGATGDGRALSGKWASGRARQAIKRKMERPQTVKRTSPGIHLYCWYQ